MADTGKIAENLERFAQAVAAHDRENPTHTAYGIGLAHFDLGRLGVAHIAPSSWSCALVVQASALRRTSFDHMTSASEPGPIGRRARAGMPAAASVAASCSMPPWALA